MNLAVSNIAWLPEEDEAAKQCLRDFGVSLIEAAPARLWPDIKAAGEGDALRVREQLDRESFSLAGFQAILFGFPQLQLFDEGTHPAMLEHLVHLANLCRWAGGSYLVFGAPKNRLIPETLNQEQAFDEAVKFFKELGTHAHERGVIIGMEANPAAYGCNFCTTIDEVARLVRAVDSPGFRWHLDTGEMAMNEELLPGAILDHADLIGSIHLSEPMLGGFENPWSGHEEVALCLRKTGVDLPLSLEMKRQEQGVASVEAALRTVSSIYLSDL
jgi:sugar phosphate isomerase/epimerase